MAQSPAYLAALKSMLQSKPQPLPEIHVNVNMDSFAEMLKKMLAPDGSIYTSPRVTPSP